MKRSNFHQCNQQLDQIRILEAVSAAYAAVDPKERRQPDDDEADGVVGGQSCCCVMRSRAATDAGPKSAGAGV